MPSEFEHKNHSFSVRRFDAQAIARPHNASRFALPSSFSPETPIDLEIGCGAGWHPVSCAKEHPERFFIAIEHTREKFDKFFRRVQTHRKDGLLDNILPVHADAVRWITHCLAPSSIDRCFILYPNPEPKAPNKRWLRMPFMSQLLQTLKPGGELILATNDKDYFDESLAFAAQTWDLIVSKTSSFSSQTAPTQKPRTHFEKKYLLRGDTCFEVRLLRSLRP